MIKNNKLVNLSHWAYKKTYWRISGSSRRVEKGFKKTFFEHIKKPIFRFINNSYILLFLLLCSFSLTF